MNKISCVISCLNEAKNINYLLKEIKKYRLEQNINFIIIDNGSTDNSKYVFRNIQSRYKNFKFLNCKKNLGWGNGILTGLKKTDTNIVGWIHGDLEYDIKCLKDIIIILKQNSFYWRAKNNFLIKGYRIKRKFSKKFFSFFMSVLCSIILNKGLTEINAQPFFFNRKEFLKWKKPFKNLALDMYAFYKLSKKNNKIIRIEVEQKQRQRGTSSWNKSFFSKIFLAKDFIIAAIKLKLCRNI